MGIGYQNLITWIQETQAGQVDSFLSTIGHQYLSFWIYVDLIVLEQLTRDGLA
jgi:hypothetical protein